MDYQWKELTVKQCKALGRTKFWERLTPRQISLFQFWQSRLVIPFEIFKTAVGETTGQPVSEIGLALLYNEVERMLLNGNPRPTFENILSFMPEDANQILLDDSLVDDGSENLVEQDDEEDQEEEQCGCGHDHDHGLDQNSSAEDVAEHIKKVATSLGFDVVELIPDSE